MLKFLTFALKYLKRSSKIILSNLKKCSCFINTNNRKKENIF